MPTSIEAEEALVAKHLLSTVEAVLIHQLSHKGSSGPLVLHAGLHQVDGVHSRGSRGCGDTQTQTELNRKQTLPLASQENSPPAMEPRVNLYADSAAWSHTGLEPSPWAWSIIIQHKGE